MTHLTWKRSRRLARATLNGLRNWLARRPAAGVLLVAADPSGGKLARVVQRLDYFLQGYVPVKECKSVSTASLAKVLTARALVEVDQGLVNPHYYKAFDSVFNVDFEYNPADGWELCRLTQFLAGEPSSARRAEAAARLRAAIDRVDTTRRRRTYVFGTGPSLEKALERNYSDGSIVVCNTIVRDPKLWHHLRPDFIAAGDAIYHFGHTAHAQAFRADLKQRLLESKGSTSFVYPELFDAIVRRELAELSALLIPVPFGEHRDIHVDLRKQFELPSLGNVLNILLLPLACTLSRSVGLWGFDGRAPDDRLFWSNSNKHSYPEHMPALLREHPAFFETFVPKGRESQYVKSVHGDELDDRLTAAEAAGFEFVMMHSSWTETLNKRTGGSRGRPQ